MTFLSSIELGTMVSVSIFVAHKVSNYFRFKPYKSPTHFTGLQTGNIWPHSFPCPNCKKECKIGNGNIDKCYICGATFSIIPRPKGDKRKTKYVLEKWWKPGIDPYGEAKIVTATVKCVAPSAVITKTVGPAPTKIKR
jgi:hypothetical protein